MSRAAPRDRLISFRVDGFVGMRNQRSAKYGPGEMDVIYNMMPESKDRPSRLLVDHGYKRVTTASTAVQLATGTPRLSLAITGIFGVVEKALLINPTGIWSIDPINGTLTAELTSAQIVAAIGAQGISNFAGACFYGSKLVVTSSGVKPWLWDGTTGAGMTSIANAPLSCRAPTVYAGKLFMVNPIGGANAIVWSEEADPTIGYGTAPYTSNTWVLQQTGQNNLDDLVGTNDGLYFFRQDRGIGIVRGEANPDFRTTATKDELSTVLGSRLVSPNARAFAGKDGAVCFFDAQQRPCIARGGRLIPLYDQLPRQAFAVDLRTDNDPFLWGLSPGGDLSGGTVWSGRAIYHDAYLGVHCYAVWSSGLSRLLVFRFHESTDQLLSIRVVDDTDSNSNVGIIWTQGVGFPLKVGISGYCYAIDFYGVMSNGGNFFNDEVFNGAGAAVTGTVVGPAHGWNDTVDYWWEFATIEADQRLSGDTIGFRFVTSHTPKGNLTTASSSVQGATALDALERRAEFGLDGFGRWLRPLITVQGPSGFAQRAGLWGYRIEARPDALARGGR
jgi:hypothetical protein